MCGSKIISSTSPWMKCHNWVCVCVCMCVFAIMCVCVTWITNKTNLYTYGTQTQDENIHLLDHFFFLSFSTLFIFQPREWKTTYLCICSETTKLRIELALQWTHWKLLEGKTLLPREFQEHLQIRPFSSVKRNQSIQFLVAKFILRLMNAGKKWWFPAWIIKYIVK